MASHQKNEPSAGPPHGDSQRLADEIGKHVIHTLGKPRGLCNVQVRRLWDDHYRVNVLVGADSLSATVAHSFFLVIDNQGAIVKSTPKITKHY